MKSFSFAMRRATAILFILSFTTCTKKGQQGAPPSSTITGYWEGKYSDDLTSYPTYPYGFLFRSDGTVRVYDETVDTGLNYAAEGTYTITGNIVNTSYKYLSGGGTYSSTATVDSDDTFMEGSWGSDTTTNTGLFFLAK
jgi:hypothetical protein